MRESTYYPEQKDITLEQRHIRGLKIPDEDVFYEGSEVWSVTSQTDKQLRYVVEKNQDSCQINNCVQR